VRLILQHKVHEMIPALQLQQHEIYDTSTSSESSESVDQKVENTGNSVLQTKLLTGIIVAVLRRPVDTRGARTVHAGSEDTQ
jgi:hypothetical protein